MTNAWLIAAACLGVAAIAGIASIVAGKIVSALQAKKALAAQERMRSVSSLDLPDTARRLRNNADF